jgi:hypothetical protein
MPNSHALTQPYKQLAVLNTLQMREATVIASSVHAHCQFGLHNSVQGSFFFLVALIKVDKSSQGLSCKKYMDIDFVLQYHEHSRGNLCHTVVCGWICRLK